MKSRIFSRPLVALLCLPTAAAFCAPLYTDDFSTNTASHYSVLKAAAPDSSAAFAFDYTGLLTGNNGSGSGAAFQIPSAPQTTDGSKKALRIDANPTQGSAQSINVFPNTVIPANTSFSFTFDFFARVPGNNTSPYHGGTGSTQRLLIGLNHSGSKLINVRQNAPADPKLTQDTDGYFFAMGCDGDFAPTSTTGRDYEFREGTLHTSPFTIACKWFGVAATEARHNASDADMLAFLDPAHGFKYFGNAGGADGDVWITARARWTAATYTYDFDLKRIGDTDFTNVFEYTDPTQTWNGGKVMIGLEDPTASTATTLNVGYHLIDNLSIDLGLPAVSDDWVLH